MENPDDKIFGEVIERIEKAINADEKLSAGFTIDIKEIGKPNPCSRNFLTTVMIYAHIPTES